MICTLSPVHSTQIIDVGSFVTWDGGTGRVDLLVRRGLVPGVDEEAAGTEADPAARVVVWEPMAGQLRPTGRRVAVKASQARRIPAPPSSAGSTGAAHLVALVAEHEAKGLPDHARPPGTAIKAVYQRGLDAWPGQGVTTLTRDEWALGRVAAFLALAAGDPPPGYRRDRDLLPAGAAAGEVKADWDSSEHPRDRRGRFIRTGARVRIAGGGMGTVVELPGRGRVTVERDSDGRRHNYLVGQLTVVFSPRPDNAGSAPESGKKPLTDAEYDAHVAALSARLNRMVRAGLQTHVTQTLNGDGDAYTPERARQHKEIVDDLWEWAAKAPSDGKAILVGGNAGAGKTTVLANHTPYNPDDYLTINPDDVKEEMAKRGMIPHVKGMPPMEAASLIHMESWAITNMLLERALEERKNVVFDVTMASRGPIRGRLQALHDSGYEQIDGIFVEIPLEMSVQRALERHRRGLEEYRAGNGYGGRYVPIELIRTSAIDRAALPPDLADSPALEAGADSFNRLVFEQMKPEFNRWLHYDNSVPGRAARLVDEKPAEPRSDSPSGGGQGSAPDVDGSEVTPLTDAEYEAHTTQLAERLDAAIKAGLETHIAHTLNGDGVTFSPERARLHREIVDDLFARAADVPTNGQAVLAGGLGGAGKSTVLGKHAGIDSSQYVTINPDDVKEEMARRGMVPEVEGVSPMEAATLIHEESSAITNMLTERVLAARMNVIFDVTMSRKASMQKRIDLLRASGYSDIEGIFVDIPVETSVERALGRHRRGLEDYRAGRGEGGRYVPPAVIRSSSHSSASSANRVVFDELRSEFGRWRVYDNSVTGGQPRLVGSG